MEIRDGYCWNEERNRWYKKIDTTKGVSSRAGRGRCWRCGKVIKLKGLTKYKGGFYCKCCYVTLSGRINGKCPGVDLEDAQVKVRPVRTYDKKDGYDISMIYLPRCYVGKKVRVVVVEDEDAV